MRILLHLLKILYYSNISLLNHAVLRPIQAMLVLVISSFILQTTIQPQQQMQLPTCSQWEALKDNLSCHTMHVMVDYLNQSQLEPLKVEILGCLCTCNIKLHSHHKLSRVNLLSLSLGLFRAKSRKQCMWFPRRSCPIKETPKIGLMKNGKIILSTAKKMWERMRR